MKQGKVGRNEVRCSTCKRVVPSYDIVHCGSIENGYRDLCNRCNNEEVAERAGFGCYQHVDYTPVSIADSTGKSHKFHFRARLFEVGVAVDAFELRAGRPDGYQFQIIGEPEQDLLGLLGRLIERIRRALSKKYLEPGGFGLQIADRTVCGRISGDLEKEHTPTMVVDGQEVTWYEFGRMLTTFEGFHFQLIIRDKNEEF